MTEPKRARLHQIRFAERQLPMVFYRHPERLVELLDSDPDKTLTALWQAAARRIPPDQRIHPPREWNVIFDERNGRRIAVAHLWRPQAAPEVGFVALVLGEPDDDGSRHVAYWMSGMHEEDGGLYAVIRGITRDRRMLLVGPQTGREADFIERVLPLDPPPPRTGWVDLFDLCGELGLPRCCPECLAYWDERDYGIGQRDRVLDLTCDNGHEHRFQLDEEQLAKAEIEIAPWLVGKPVLLRGGPSDGLHFDLPGGAGTTIHHEGETYAFARELDGVYEYRHQHPQPGP
jgi:hypothetical protein